MFGERDVGIAEPVAGGNSRCARHYDGHRQQNIIGFGPAAPQRLCLSLAFGMIMIRFIAFVVCVGAFAWLGLGTLHFRQSIRTSLKDAYSLMHRVDPDHATDSGKVLNSYYGMSIAISPPPSFLRAC